MKNSMCIVFQKILSLSITLTLLLITPLSAIQKATAQSSGETLFFGDTSIDDQFTSQGSEWTNIAFPEEQASAPACNFIDLETLNINHPAIVGCEKGYWRGDPAGFENDGTPLSKFIPKRIITYPEFLSMIFKAHEIDRNYYNRESCNASNFEWDLIKDEWYKDLICDAVSEGMIDSIPSIFTDTQLKTYKNMRLEDGIKIIFEHHTNTFLNPIQYSHQAYFNSLKNLNLSFLNLYSVSALLLNLIDKNDLYSPKDLTREKAAEIILNSRDLTTKLEELEMTNFWEPSDIVFYRTTLSDSDKNSFLIQNSLKMILGAGAVIASIVYPPSGLVQIFLLAPGIAYNAVEGAEGFVNVIAFTVREDYRIQDVDISRELFDSTLPQEYATHADNLLNLLTAFKQPRTLKDNAIRLGIDPVYSQYLAYGIAGTSLALGLPQFEGTLKVQALEELDIGENYYGNIDADNNTHHNNTVAEIFPANISSYTKSLYENHMRFFASNIKSPTLENTSNPYEKLFINKKTGQYFILQEVDISKDMLFHINLARLQQGNSEIDESQIQVFKQYLLPIREVDFSGKREILKSCSYNDINQVQKYYNSIYSGCSLGWWKGSENFLPQNPVTRAEFVKMAMNSAGIAVNNSATSAFSDISEHPLEEYINTLSSYGAFEDYIPAQGGFLNGSQFLFQPNKQISYEEAIDIAIGVHNISKQGTFDWPSDTYNNYFIQNEFLKDHGLVDFLFTSIEQKSDGTIDQKIADDASIKIHELTREEAAEIVYSLYNLRDQINDEKSRYASKDTDNLIAHPTLPPEETAPTLPSQATPKALNWDHLKRIDDDSFEAQITLQDFVIDQGLPNEGVNINSQFIVDDVRKVSDTSEACSHGNHLYTTYKVQFSLNEGLHEGEVSMVFTNQQGKTLDDLHKKFVSIPQKEVVAIDVIPDGNTYNVKMKTRDFALDTNRANQGIAIEDYFSLSGSIQDNNTENSVYNTYIIPLTFNDTNRTSAPLRFDLYAKNGDVFDNPIEILIDNSAARFASTQPGFDKNWNLDESQGENSNFLIKNIASTAGTNDTVHVLYSKREVNQSLIEDRSEVRERIYYMNYSDEKGFSYPHQKIYQENQTTNFGMDKENFTEIRDIKIDADKNNDVHAIFTASHPLRSDKQQLMYINTQNIPEPEEISLDITPLDDYCQRAQETTQSSATTEIQSEKVYAGINGTVYGSDIVVSDDVVYITAGIENNDTRSVIIRSKTLDENDFLGQSYSTEGTFPQIAKNPVDNSIHVFYKKNSFLYSKKIIGNTLSEETLIYPNIVENTFDVEIDDTGVAHLTWAASNTIHYMRSDDLDHYYTIDNEEGVARLTFDLDAQNEPHFSWHNKFSFSPIFYQQLKGENFFKARQITPVGENPQAPSDFVITDDGKRFIFWMGKNTAEDDEPYRLFGTYTTGESSDFANDSNEFFGNIGTQKNVVINPRLIECDDTPVEPVCGVDGKDYQNACLAQRAGTQVESEGVCYVPPPEVRLSEGIDPIISIDFENGIADNSENNFQVNASASVEETAANNVGKFHKITIQKIEDTIANTAVDGVVKSENNTFAVSAWLYQLVENDKDKELIFTNSIVLAIDQNNRLNCRLADETIISSNIDINHLWTHVACSYDGTSLKMFVNGKEHASKEVTADIRSQKFQTRYGGKFTGYLDDIVLTRNPVTEESATHAFNQKINSLRSTILPTINNAPQSVVHYGFDVDNIGINKQSIQYSQRAIKNQALELNENTEIQIPFPSSISQNDFSYSAWIYPQNNINNRNGRLLRFDETSALQVNKRYTVKGASTKVYFYKNNLSGLISASNTDGFPDNEWYHVLVSVKNGQVEIFVDGQSYNTGDMTFEPFKMITIGGGFRGSLDELEFYNGSVTQEQAQEIYEYRKAEALRDDMMQKFTTAETPLKFQLQVKEHRDSSSADPNASFSKKSRDNIDNILFLTNSYRETGSVYAFATFPKHFLKDKKILINWESNNTAKSSRYKTRYYARLLDGAYDASSSTDFPNKQSLAKKGYAFSIKTFGSLENTQPREVIIDNLPHNVGSENEATIMFHAYNTNDRYNSTGMRIYDIQILNKNDEIVAMWDRDGPVTMAVTNTDNDYGVAGSVQDDFTKLREPTQVAHLAFEKEHGKYNTYIKDSSDYKNNGLYEESTKPGYDSQKQAVTFNGNQYFHIANNATTQFDDRSFSISLWAKTNQANQLADIIVKNQDSENGSILIRQGQDTAGGNLWVQLYEDDNNTVQSESIENVFSRDKWRHITVVYNKQSQKLEAYVNGTLRSETTIIGNPRFSSDSNWYIAQGKKSGNNWNGSIANIQMFNYALGANTILESFESEKGRYISRPLTLDTPVISVNAHNSDLPDFNGIDGSIELEDIELGDQYGISAWVKTNDIQKRQNIISKHTYEGNDIINLEMNNGKYQFTIRDNTITGGSITTDWQHVSATIKRLTKPEYLMKLYVNGELVAEKIVNIFSFETEGRGWSVGQDWDGNLQSDFYDGEIGSIEVFNKQFKDNTDIEKIFEAEKYTYFPEALNDIKLQIRTQGKQGNYQYYEPNITVEQPEDALVRFVSDKEQQGQALVLLTAPKELLNNKKLKIVYSSGPRNAPRYRYKQQSMYVYDGAYDVAKDEDFSEIRQLNGEDKVYYNFQKKGVGTVHIGNKMYDTQSYKELTETIKTIKAKEGLVTLYITGSDSWNYDWFDYTIHSLQIVDDQENPIFDFQPGKEIEWVEQNEYEQAGYISQ